MSGLPFRELHEAEHGDTHMAITSKLMDLISNAKANAKSDNFRDGTGVAMVEELVSFEGNDGPTFVARFEIVSSAPKGDLDETGKPVTPNAPGSQVGWVQKLAKFKSSAGNVKAMVLALIGKTEGEIDAEPGLFANMFAGLLAPEQMARGMLVNYSTYRQATRSGPNAGKVNTYVAFSAHADNSDEAVAKRRAELDARRPLKVASK